MPRVVVVGGGVTGTGVARDLAQRGFETVLLEKGTLTHGTSGHMHGVLHSGARYAISDPPTAKQCIAENQILREIAPHCINETGGLFVKLRSDPNDHAKSFYHACQACQIPIEEVNRLAVQTREPALTDDVEEAFSVPDGTIDPFRLCAANALAAGTNGARIETNAAVTDLIVEGDRVAGVEVRFDPTESRGTVEHIPADFVINATGAWTRQLAGMVDIDIPLQLSKGAMVVVDAHPVDSVINRCRPKSEGDIVVPYGKTAILGTTDREIADPEKVRGEQAEIELLVDELARVLPILSDADRLRSFWGVRALYDTQQPLTVDSAELSRGFSLVDHTIQDDLGGFITILGGKLTIYRLMAEQVVDRVCSLTGTEARCRTEEVPLPGSTDQYPLEKFMAEYGTHPPIPWKTT